MDTAKRTTSHPQRTSRLLNAVLMSQARGKKIHPNDERAMWFGIAKLAKYAMQPEQVLKLIEAFGCANMNELAAKRQSYMKKNGFTDVVSQAERDAASMERGRVAADTQAVERSLFDDPVSIRLEEAGW